MRNAEDRIIFLFDGLDLINVTSPARDIMQQWKSRQSDWESLIAFLSVQFPDVRSRAMALDDGEVTELASATNRASFLSIEKWDGFTRFSITASGRNRAEDHVRMLTMEAVEDELETLRALGTEAPFPVWKQDARGIITWANQAFLSLGEQLHPTENGRAADWPPQQVFSDLTKPEDELPVIERRAIVLAGGVDQSWFDVTSIRRGTGSLHFATDANASVRSEHAQRQFVQTLSKTFAQLSVGLAIFNRDRELVTFNPALISLTDLPADFLAARPQLGTLLDRLRERQMIPEPSDYRNWRDHIADLENAARDGSYREVWPLPNGRTYQVTGRPHPDGAFAFLFEDISAEISLTRRFRSQIDIAHATLDHVEDAVVIFSEERVRLHSNRAYQSLWPDDAEQPALTTSRFEDELSRWQDNSVPSTKWDDLRNSAATERQGWTGFCQLSDGRSLSIRLEKLPAGAFIVVFRHHKKTLVHHQDEVPKLSQSQAVG